MEKRRNSIGTQSSYVHFNSDLGVHTWMEKDRLSELGVEKKLFCFAADLGHHPTTGTSEFCGGVKFPFFESVWVWRKPINIACNMGSLAAFKTICRQGAQICCFSDEEDPIFVAIWNRKVDIVKYLLRWGLVLNVYKAKRGSPLWSACWVAAFPPGDDERPYEIVSLLLDYGADMDERKAGGTPLWEHILWLSNIRLVELFVKKGVDCTMIDKEGNNVVDIFICGYVARKYYRKEKYSTAQLVSLFEELKQRGAPVTESEIVYKANAMTNTGEKDCCGICMDNKEMRIVLPCCHFFCDDCTSRLVDCAICRSMIVNIY